VFEKLFPNANLTILPALKSLIRPGDSVEEKLMQGSSGTELYEVII
jgi:hypothetical protein